MTDMTLQGRTRAASGPRIAFFGLFGNGNSGNDGSLEAMLIAVRKRVPTARITCVCADPDRIRQAFGVSTLPIGHSPIGSRLLGKADRLLAGFPHRIVSFRRAIRALRGTTLFVVPGTGILDDFGEGPLGVPCVLLGWCAAARIAGAKVAFVSIGAGPIESRISRVLMKAAVKLADYRSYRDEQSRDFMTSIGFDTSGDRVYPDLAFALPAPKAAPVANGRLTVGLGVMAYYGWRNDPAAGAATHTRYVQTISTFADWLLGEGHRVRILMGDAADRETVRRVILTLRADTIIPPGDLEADPIASLGDLMRQIAKTDVVVATRFHNIICALKLGRPTISIGYARKNDVLLQEAGLGAYCQSIEALDLDRLKDQFRSLVANRASLTLGIQAMVDRFKGELLEQEVHITDMLLNPTEPADASRERP
jgi:polysaccharide pyruvyl transferase WcaK-like protein